MKRKNNNNNDSDSDDENILKTIQVQDDHIYFYGDVNLENAMNLVMIINKLNSEKKKYDELFFIFKVMVVQ